MGKYLLLILAALAFSMASVFHSASTNSFESVERFGEHGSKIIAREVALSGLNESLERILNSYEQSGTYTGPSTIMGSFDNGTFQVDITTAGNNVTIKAIGHFGALRHIILRNFYYLSGGIGGSSLPPFLEKALICEHNLTFNRGMTLISPDPSKNVEVHANHNLTVNEASNTYITGFGTAGSNVTVNDGTPEDAFVPNVNPGGLPVTQSNADSVNIPVFSATDYLDIATQVTSSDVNLSGIYPLGTEENPVIWYIDGNVKTDGPVQFTGYGALVVNGNMTVKHNLLMSGGNDESSLAFYVDGNLTFDVSGGDVAGTYMIGHDYTFQKEMTFSGSIISGGHNCTFNREITMSYVAASPELAAPFWDFEGEEEGSGNDGPGRLLLGSAREW